MKQIMLLTVIIILVPFLVITILVKNNTLFFFYDTNEQNMVRVKRETTGQIDTVSFEEYIKGVLAGEVPTSFHIEALKAQAVAARSYAMKKIEDNTATDYDVVDTVSNQVYMDDEMLKEKWKDQYDEKMKIIERAVNETKGEYLEYDGKVAQAFFFSTSAGKTENSEEVFQSALPYLRSVDSSWDQEVSPVFQQDYQFSVYDFYQKLGLPYQDTVQFQITKQTSTGRVKEVNIDGTVVKASDVSSKLGLRSTFFTLEQIGSNIHMTTKGYGHGVGMSQYGAQAMALKGSTYDEILKHYYQGVQIKKK